MDRELLIEIGVEELPASWMPALTTQLRQKLKAQLSDFRLGPLEEPESFSTPRRLTARVAKIAERQEDLEETVTGPPVSAALGPDGQPTPAALGFAKKHRRGYSLRSPHCLNVSYDGLANATVDGVSYAALPASFY